MRIVFMGNPDFAVATLDAIYQAGYTIVAVVTSPDKPAGRGKKLHMPEVKQYALSKDLPILQPAKLKDQHFIEQLQSLKADLFVVVAFRILPEEVFTIPPYGTFNVHASLLPEYRGAAPIHRAVMNGETRTGVTTFFLNKDMDKGDIIDFKEIEIGDKETTGELYDRMKYIGASLAVETIKKIEMKEITLIPQSVSKEGLKLAPKILKEDCLIDWNNTACDIFNKIRGLSPFPGAYTQIRNKQGEIYTFKCYQSAVSTQKALSEPGCVHTDGKNFFAVDTSDFQILLENIQWQGKSRMDIKAFLGGFRKENYTMRLF